MPHAHPVVADSGGKVAAIYVPAGAYKVRITNAAGTTLYEVDNYIVNDLDAVNTDNYPVSAKTTDYTMVAADEGAMIAMDASAASPKTITAGSTTLTNGFPFCAINSGATGTVTITPSGAETINGAASYSLTRQYQSACFVSRGASGWYVWAERNVGTPLTLTDATTIAWDMTTGGNFVVTLGGNRTLAAPTGEESGQTGTLRVIQDATGSRTLTFNAAYAQYGGLAMRPDQTASATTLYRYDVRGADDVILTRIWTSAADSIGIYKEYISARSTTTRSIPRRTGSAAFRPWCRRGSSASPAELGWAVGDRVEVTNSGPQDSAGGAEVGGISTGMNATNVYRSSARGTGRSPTRTPSPTLPSPAIAGGSMSACTSDAVTNNTDVQRSLGRIEGKLDSFLLRFDAHVEEDGRRSIELNKADHALHERLSSAENKLSFWAGKIAGVTFLVTAGATEFIRRVWS